MIIKIFKKLFQILGINYIINGLKKRGVLPSGVLLILVNLIPIFGVLFFGWNAFDIVILYWVENIVIGICTLPRILFAQNRDSQSKILDTHTAFNSKPVISKIFNYLSNVFFGFFFLLHFGTFTLVHGLFIRKAMLGRSSFLINQNYSAIGVFFLALIISHGFSLIYNYILKGEYKRYSAPQGMLKPYPRIFVIQMTIIIGASFVTSVSNTALVSNLLILLFVVVKIIFDLGMHIKSHLGMQAKDFDIQSDKSVLLTSDKDISPIDNSSLIQVSKSDYLDSYFLRLFAYIFITLFLAITIFMYIIHISQ